MTTPPRPPRPPSPPPPRPEPPEPSRVLPELLKALAVVLGIAGLLLVVGVGLLVAVCGGLR
jgi:hypothetical protein